MSRFSTRSAPEASTPPAPPSDPTAKGPSTDLLARHQALLTRGNEQNERRAQYKGRLELVIQQDRDLTAQAQALGANTPDELLQKIEDQDRADALALDQYETALNEEQRVLDAIDRDLAELDAAE